MSNPYRRIPRPSILEDLENLKRDCFQIEQALGHDEGQRTCLPLYRIRTQLQKIIEFYEDGLPVCNLDLPVACLPCLRRRPEREVILEE